VRRICLVLAFVLLRPIDLFAWSPFAFREEMREGGPWLGDTVLAAIAGFLAGWPVLFVIYLSMGVKYRKRANVLGFAVKATWERIGSFMGAFVIGCFAYCLVLMLPGFIIYSLWHTFHGIPIGNKNIHVLHWLYASVFVFSYITALVITIKGTDSSNFLQKT
jgi:ABC-type multidrug transport system permease subunit